MSDFMWCDIFNYEYLQGGTIRKYTVQEYFLQNKEQVTPKLHMLHMHEPLATKYVVITY